MNSKIRSCASMAVVMLSMALPALADVSPTQAYMTIRQKELVAKTYEDLLPLRTKESISHDEKHSAEENAMMLDLMKATMPKTVKVTNEVVNGTNATLTVMVMPDKPAANSSAMEERGKGIVKMGFEDGQWKLIHEDWKTELKSAGQFAAETKTK